MAGVMVMLASVFVVLSVWDTVSRLRSIETRESIEKFLAEAPGKELGMSVETMTQLLQGIASVAALCAVASVALGWQALQGSRSGRVALSVLAVPTFVTGLVAGGFMSSLVVVATALLWLSPSREWFAGKPIPEPVAPGGGAKEARDQATVHAMTGRAPDPTGDAATPQLTQPGPSPTDWSAQPLLPPTPTKRPDPATVALAITLVTAGLIFVFTLISVVVLATQPDLVIEELRRQNPDLDDQGISESMLLTTSVVSGSVAMAWSGIAVVLAVLMAGRRAWAGRALMISAGACAALCLVATFASPIALIPAVAAVATISCLRRPEVQAWLRARR